MEAVVPKRFHRIRDCSTRVAKLQNTSAKGYDIGFFTVGNNISIKKGVFTIVGAPPASGKSELVLEIQLNTSIRYGWKHFVYIPEMGDEVEITALLIHKLTGKSVLNIAGVPLISADEREQAIEWLDNHFVIVEGGDKGITMEEVFEECELCEKELGIIFDTVSIDNLNDLKMKNREGSRQDLEIEEELTFVRRFCKTRKKHAFLVTHASSQGFPMSANGISFYPPITPRQLRGGEALYRKGYLMLTVWRPPYGLADEAGEAYAENEAHVIVMKAKPTHTAIKGSVSKLYWDWKKSRFYEKGCDMTDRIFYGCEWEEYSNPHLKVNVDKFVYEKNRSVF